MFDAVQFLAALAERPRLPSDDEFATAVADVEPAARPALLARDGAALALAIGGRPWMACAVSLPDGDEPQPAEQDEPQEPESEEVRAA